MSLSAIMKRQQRMPLETPTGETVLSMRNITVTFGERTVLQNIDLDIRAGEVLALVGPNGAGKSTLLNVITNDVETSSGEVTVNGFPNYSWTNQELAMRRAVLLQQSEVSFPFSVMEVIEMGRAPWAHTPAQKVDKQIVAAAMDRTETTRFGARKFTTLSGGEKSRVALARVLAQAAPILLLDEPTAAMDIRHQEMVLTLARQYAMTGSAVVIIVHSLDLAGAYADRVALLAHGGIVADGSPTEVLTAPIISAAYDYPVNIVEDPISGAPMVIPVRTLRKDIE